VKESALFLSVKGETLPVVKELRKEGVPVEIYVHDLAHGRNYANILPRVGLNALPEAVNRNEVLVIDTISRNKKTDRDLAFLDKFKISHNVLDLFGRFADKFRRSKLIIGGSEETAEYELDRAKGMELAKKVGFSIPTYHEFHSLKETAKFLDSSEGRKQEKWFFKGHGNLALDLTQEGTPDQLIDYLTTNVAKRLGTD
jgi:hypothetical protein